MSSVILIFKKFFRNKLNYIVFILIGLSFAFAIMINSLTYSAKVYFEDNVLNFVSYRQFSILGSEDNSILIEKLKKMPEIEGVFDSYGYVSSWTVPEFSKYAIDKDVPGFWLAGVVGNVKSIIGEDLLNSDSPSMVCPNVYYSDSDKTNKIDLTEYVGKNLTLEYSDGIKSKEFSVKLVGLFDNDRLNQDYRTCYINYKDLEKMNKEVISFNNVNVYYELKNIVDENKVTNAIQEMGYFPEPIIFMDRSLAIESLDILVYISYILFIISMFVVSCIVYFNFIKNKSNISLNKSFGYSNKDITLNYFIQNIILFISSIITTVLLLNIILAIFKKVIPLYYPSFKYVELLISPTAFWLALLTMFVLCLILSLIFIIFSLKINAKGGEK